MSVSSAPRTHDDFPADFRDAGPDNPGPVPDDTTDHAYSRF